MTVELDETRLEAVAKAICTADEQNGGLPWEHPVVQSKHARATYMDRAEAAIRAYEEAAPIYLRSAVEVAWHKARNAWMAESRHRTQEEADKAATEALYNVLARAEGREASS